MLADGLNFLEEGVDISKGTVDDNVFVMSGNLVVQNKFSRWHPPAAISISSIVASVGFAPFGSAINIVVSKNGVPMTTLPISIEEGTTLTEITNADMLVNTAGVDDYITFSVTQIGSITPGRDLTVQVVFVIV